MGGEEAEGRARGREKEGKGNTSWFSGSWAFASPYPHHNLLISMQREGDK